MRFLYIGAYRFPNLDAAAMRVINNAKALRELGHDVSFISMGGTYQEQDLCPDGKYRFGNFEYIITNEIDIKGGFFEKFIGYIKQDGKTIKLLQSIGKNYDAWIIYNPDYTLTSRCIKLAKLYNIKLISDLTEWYNFNDLIPSSWLFYHYTMTLLQKKIRNKIVISSFLQSYYNDGNTVIVPPLIDQRQIPIHSSIKINPEIKFIYAGTPAKKDMLFIAVDVINKLLKEGANISFEILGIDKQIFLSHYSKYLKDYKLHNNIHFYGKVRREIVNATYKKADFTILLRKPNRKSNAGFPTKVVESMSNGVPIITNSTSDLKKYIYDGINGFCIDGYNMSSLYKLIKTKILILDKEEMNMMKSETYKLGFKFFDFHNSVQIFDSFSNKLI